MKFAGDGTKYERVLMVNIEETEWVTLDGHRRMVGVDFLHAEDQRYSPLSREIPKGFDRNDCELFEDCPDGDMAVDGFMDFLAQADVPVSNRRPKWGLPLLETKVVSKMWVCCTPGSSFGKEFQQPANTPNAGGFCILDQGGGDVPFLEEIDRTSYDDWISRREREFRDHFAELTRDEKPEDCRIEPVAFDPSGERWRDFKDGVQLLTEEPFEGFPFLGHRSVRWLLREMARGGLTPTRAVAEWKTKSKIQDGDRCLFEMEVLADILELAITYDHLNSANLARV